MRRGNWKLIAACRATSSVLLQKRQPNINVSKTTHPTLSNATREKPFTKNIAIYLDRGVTCPTGSDCCNKREEPLLVVGTKFRLDKVFESELENLVFRVIEYNKDDTGTEI